MNVQEVKDAYAKLTADLVDAGQDVAVILEGLFAHANEAENTVTTVAPVAPVEPPVESPPATDLPVSPNVEPAETAAGTPAA